MIKKLAVAILGIIFIGSSTFLGKELIKRYGENKKLEEIQLTVKNTEELQENSTESSLAQAINETEQPTEEVEVETETEEPRTILPEFSELYAENTDMCGWLKIENTNIDYPVMFTPEEPNFYLHLDWNKQESSHGMIYIDERSDLENSDNLIFYGHCMRDRTMFGSLRDYKEESFYLEHPLIEYDTLYEKNSYQVISVFVGEAYYEEVPEDTFIYYNQINFLEQEEFDYFYNNIKELSIYDTGIEAEYGDKFITLSTCSYEFENARTVVIAKKIN